MEETDVKKTEFCKRLLAITLSVMMVMQWMPVSAKRMEESKRIISFQKLSSDISVQNVPLGTTESELNLPKILMATVCPASETEKTEQEEQSQIPRVTNTSGSAIISVPVTWSASPEYDGSIAKTYIFTPGLPENFSVKGNIELPIITVAVEKTAVHGEITAFDELPDEIRWQNTASPNFPETVRAIVDGKASNIPVTWKADHEYNAASPANGLYVFTARIGTGNVIAHGVDVPRITVYIPVVRQMLRMTRAEMSDSMLTITTAEQLAEIATLVNTGKLETFLLNNSEAVVNLVLGNDIDLSEYGENWNCGKGWIPIGNSDHAFKGMLNGNQKTITGLYIKDTSLKEAGLFGTIRGGTVKNLGIADERITGGQYVGSVAGSITDGSVKNCFSTGMFTGDQYVGGMAGIVDKGSINCCYTIGTVTGNQYVGGVAGRNCNDGSITNCAALNEGVSGSDYAGRVAGMNEGMLSGNIAFSGMKVMKNSKPKTIVNNAADVDGEDRSAAEIKGDGTLDGHFTTENGWTTLNGKLPGLGKSLDIPDYIVDSNGSVFRGEGTSDSPYQISTAAQLAQLATLVNADDKSYNGKCYKLTADIDLSTYNAANKDFNGGRGWIPIGIDTNRNAFQGTFDGGGNIVTGLYINSSKSDPIGLFSSVDSNATVENLGIKNMDITGSGYGVGGVAGYNNGNIQNCFVSGSVSGSSGNVGGVCGSTSNKDGGDRLKNCYAICSVHSSGDQVGGIVGCVSSETVRNCYATGSVIGRSEVGGVVGHAANGSQVNNCAALNCKVCGNGCIGRIVGCIDRGSSTKDNKAFSDMRNGEGKATFKDGTVLNGEGKTFAAIAGTGFFQSLFQSNSAWIYADGRLPILKGFSQGTQDAAIPHYMSGSYFGGGDGSSEAQAYEIFTAAQLAKLAELVNAGDTSYNGKYYKLAEDIDLSGYGASNADLNSDSGKGWIPIGKYDKDNTKSFHGMFDGQNHVVTGLYINRGELYTGLFGCIDGGKVQNLGLTDANITSSKDNVGGIAGYISKNNIENCYVKGKIIGSNKVGGVVGSVDNGTVRNCYVTSTVSGSNNVGGVVGYMDNKTVQNCYTIGVVSCSGNSVGGVAGYVKTGLICNCYTTGSVSGGSTVGGLVGQMNNENTKVSDCIAINPAISGSSCVGRIVGKDSCGLSDNMAFSGMTVRTDGKVTKITGGAANNINGTDVTISRINEENFWTNKKNWDGNSAWSSSDWTFTDGKLPILKNVGGLQSDVGGVYLTDRDILYANVTLDHDTYTYDGTAKMATPTVTFDDVTLVKGTDYTYQITSSDIKDESAGTNAGKVILMITGKGNFKGSKNVTYEINKAPAPNIIWPEAASITYGGKLSSSALTGGSTAYGSFAWTNGNTVPVVKNSGYSVTFTSSEKTTENYESIKGTEKIVAIKVTKALAPVITWPEAASITYGGKLLSSALTGGSTVYGSFAWTNGNTVPTVKNSGYRVTFTSSEKTTENYESIKGTEKIVAIKVTKAPAPVITWPEAASITYGRKLLSSALTGGSTAYGNFAWTDGNTVPVVKNSGYSVTFMPNEKTIENYESIKETEKDVAIKVNRAPAPTITWPEAGSITYGGKLSSSALTGGSTNYGSFAWTDGNTVPVVKNSGYSVIFTPSEKTIENYESIKETEKDVAIKVNKAPAPTITWPEAASITYGGKLSSSALTGGSTAYGSFAWTDGNTVPVVKSSGYSVTFTPSESTAQNYEIIKETEKLVAIKVNKAPAPAITWPEAASITYGNKLLSSNLIGGSTVYGSFAWTESNIKPTVKNNGYSVTFTPSESTAQNYETIKKITKVVAIKVTKAPAPVITWPEAASITYGSKLSSSALTGGSTAYGSFAWTDGNTVPIVKNSGYSVTFTPSEKTTENYELIKGTEKIVAIKVTKAPAPVITWPEAASITYGGKLFSSALTGGSTAYGNFAWTDGNTVPVVKNSGYSVTFTPSKKTIENYESIKETEKDVAIKVNKAPAPTITWPEAASIT
jgi:hypothetical protein